MPNVKFDGKCLITAPKPTFFFFLNFLPVFFENSSLAVWNILSVSILSSAFQARASSSLWEAEKLRWGSLEEWDHSNIVFVAYLYSQFHGQHSSVASFWGFEVLFLLSVPQLFFPVNFCTISLWLYFYHLLYSYHSLYSMRVNCGVHGGDVIKPGSRAAWECVSDPRWNDCSKWDGWSLKCPKSCHRNCVLWHEIQVQFTVLNLVRAQALNLLSTAKVSAMSMKLFWEYVCFLPAIFCCWSNDEFGCVLSLGGTDVFTKSQLLM